MSDQVIPQILSEATATPTSTAPVVPPSSPSPAQSPVTLSPRRDPDFIARGKDARGRMLGIKKLNMGAKFAMLRVLSADSASKAMMYYWAELACSVCEIDGEHIPMPGSELAIQAMLQRLDDEGIECVGRLRDQYFPPISIEAAKN